MSTSSHAATPGSATIAGCEERRETSRPWLVVLDDLADPANLEGLWPAGPAGRVLVTSADATAVPRGVRVVPVGPFSVREAISYLNGRLSGARCCLSRP